MIAHRVWVHQSPYRIIRSQSLRSQSSTFAYVHTVNALTATAFVHTERLRTITRLWSAVQQ